MFNKYIRYFNQNKSKVIMIVIAVILAFILIQALNQFIEDENKSRINELTNTVIIDKEIKDSVIKEGSTSTEVAKKSKSMIDEFVKYCNTRNTKKAYELLSQDCKDILFPTEEDFINTYYNLVFNSYKEYEIENWVSNGNYITYKIRYTNDALAQGGYKSEYTLEDYYTIVKQKDDYKLNINKFVSREQINKSQTKDNFSINVVARENFIDYQIYEVYFNNKNAYPVKTYDESESSTWNVTDERGLEYLAFTNEIPDNNLRVESGVEKKIKIKYAKMYNLNRKISEIKFNNMYFENGVTKGLFSFDISI